MREDISARVPRVGSAVKQILLSTHWEEAALPARTLVQRRVTLVWRQATLDGDERQQENSVSLPVCSSLSFAPMP